MHCLLVWETDKPEVQAELSQKVCACFEEFESVHIFGNTYVIKIPGNGLYERVQKRLLEAAKAEEQCTLTFIMSPLQRSGRYAGRMKEELKDSINTIVED